MSDAGSEYDEDFDENDKNYIGVSVCFKKIFSKFLNS
jgi:hypothetical protein